MSQTNGLCVSIITGWTWWPWREGPSWTTWTERHSCESFCHNSGLLYFNTYPSESILFIPFYFLYLIQLTLFHLWFSVSLWTPDFLWARENIFPSNSLEERKYDKGRAHSGKELWPLCLFSLYSFCHNLLVFLDCVLVACPTSSVLTAWAPHCNGTSLFQNEIGYKPNPLLKANSQYI